MTARARTAFVLGVLACAAVGLAGSYVAVQAFGSTVQEFELGSVRAEVDPALDGGVDVYVPIVDWGVRADAFDAPLVLGLRFRSVDRAAARSALRSGADANVALARLRRDVVEIARSAFAHAFTLLGTSYERRLVGEIAAVGDPVVAVSGNHDSRPFMRALAAEGVIVLTRDGRLRADGSIDGDRAVRVAGLTVVGYDDPLEGRGEGLEGRPLELKNEELAEAARAFVEWFDRLESRPDVVLVHQQALAHTLLASLPARTTEPLLILTGHDHVQHFEQRGSAILVDGGTVGAGGPFAIGEQRVGFAELRFAEGALRALDTIEVEPLTGDARAERHVLGDLVSRR